MPIAYYISHPQVVAIPAVAIGDWSLSDLGRQKARAMLRQSWVPSIGRIVSAGERKAMETAQTMATRLGLSVEVWERDAREQSIVYGLSAAVRVRGYGGSFLRIAGGQHPGLGTRDRRLGADFG